MKTLTSIFLVLAAGTALSACGTTTTERVATGALGGAAAGALVDGTTGAVIGGVGGAAVGAVVDQNQKAHGR